MLQFRWNETGLDYHIVFPKLFSPTTFLICFNCVSGLINVGNISTPLYSPSLYIILYLLLCCHQITRNTARSTIPLSFPSVPECKERDGSTLGVSLYPAHLELLSSGAKCRTEVSFSAAGGASRNENSCTEVRSFHSAGAALRMDRAAVNLKDQKGFRLAEQRDTSQTTQSPRHEGPNLVVVKKKKKR